MKHLLLTTIAAVVLTTTAFADPIHNAAYDGDLAGVQAELDKGVDVNEKNDYGRTPLDLASGETADLLREHGGKSGAEFSIHVAAELGNIEAVKQHLAAGADVNLKGKFGETPLHWAALEGHKEIAELLIAKGADVNAKDYDGDTPLLLATAGESVTLPLGSGHKEIAELLLAECADVNAKNQDGETPLDGAMDVNAFSEIADLLRKHQLPCFPPPLILVYSKDKLTINVPFDFRFTTKAGKSYTVEATGDLLKWNKVKTIRGTGSEVKFTDTREALFEMQYYRVKLVE